jgi:hypothetical protein
MALAQPMRYTMDDLLRTTVERGASDLHLTVGLPPVLRINGSLVATEFARLSPDESKRLVYSVLNDKQKEKFEKSWELDCSHGVRGFGRFRVNVYRQRGVIGACLRAISNTVSTRIDLSLPKIIEECVNRPHGLILVTGATGAGKSTTLACMLDIINQTQSYHIITIEDPIEYIHPHKKSMINQREVGQDTMSWANALKATLREDDSRHDDCCRDRPLGVLNPAHVRRVSDYGPYRGRLSAASPATNSSPAVLGVGGNLLAAARAPRFWGRAGALRGGSHRQSCDSKSHSRRKDEPDL